MQQSKRLKYEPSSEPLHIGGLHRQKAFDGGVQRDLYFIAKQPASAPHTLRIVPHTAPRVGRSYEHFPDGFELHTSYPCLVFLSWRRSQVACARGDGFRVQGSGFRVQGSGFRVQGSGCRVQGSGFMVHGSWFRVQGSGCVGYRGTSLIRKRLPLGTYSRPMPRALRWS